VYDPGFTRDVIAKNKEQLVTGRNLQERALAVVHNYKFALKYYKEFVDSKSQNPSGCIRLDMLMYVRKTMFLAFKGCRNKPTGKQAACKEHLTEDDMPPKYIFNGYMAFALFGPQGFAEQTLGVLSEDGKGVKKKGRAAQRKEEAKVIELERNSGSGGYVPEDYRHGISIIQTKAQSAFLAQTEHNNTIKSFREMLVIANQEQQNNIRELEFIDMQMKGTIHPGDYEQMQGWKEELFSRLTKIRRNKEQYEQKISELLEQTPQQSVVFYDQVGNFNTKRRAGEGFIHTSAKKSKKSADEFSQLTESSQEFHGGTVTLEEDSEADR